ncbi:MAG TPA: S1 family peptidase [Nannocystaceae bacterium]|nr:S1 family peptidase [Nannocystaceae bacterium]
MRMRSWLAGSSLGLLAWSRIGDAHAAPAGIEELRAEPPAPRPIVGGEPTEAGDFDGVVAVVAGSGLCTGTVVAPRLVLTAAHCLAGLRQDTEIEVYFGQEINAADKVAATDYGVHPMFCPDCKEDIYDYGYVVIASDFTVPDGFLLPITTQDEWDEAMVDGREVTLVGYGEDPEIEALNKGIGVKREVTTTVRRFSDRGLEFYAGGMHRDSCNGDSGGPAFIRVGSGALRLAGITSRGSNPCGDGGYYGTPYPALCWVRDETGVDLIGPNCSACDCLDIATDDDEGCAVARPRERDDERGSLALLVVLATLQRWRSRRRAG